MVRALLLCKYVTNERLPGEFRDNKRAGQGTYSYADGSKYEGSWSDDCRNGG